jgi:hypothetical protein
MSPDELASAQEACGVAFPPDLCDLLAETLPTGRQFPDWRTRARESFESFRATLIAGIHFDVLHNDFWLTSWGEQPTDAAESLAVVTEQVYQAPALIPIYSHRAIPNEPEERGNPVFSLVQTDIMTYGHDLDDYLRHEFHLSPRVDQAEPRRAIRFWTQMLG